MADPGGYFAMPRLQGSGFCLTGDTAGFVNMSRLKGIHLAIKSGNRLIKRAFEIVTLLVGLKLIWG